MEVKDIRELLKVAIGMEEEAHLFYTNVASNLDNPSLVSMFKELAAEEIQHKLFLQGLSDRSDLKIVINAPKHNFKITEQIELPQLTMEMKPADAIAIAMKKELQSAEFYENLAENTTDQGIKDTALSLANMELEHKAKLENAYVDIAYIESF
jgi:rubrerythrin